MVAPTSQRTPRLITRLSPRNLVSDQALQQDPLFVVVTEEEQEALDDGDLPTINLAKKLVDDVRRRKGLRVEDKVVASATKQRTISRKR